MSVNVYFNLEKVGERQWRHGPITERQFAIVPTPEWKTLEDRHPLEQLLLIEGVFEAAVQQVLDTLPPGPFNHSLPTN